MRGPLLPPTVPAWRGRNERFDDLLLAVVEELEARWPQQLDKVEFAVEEVPPSDPTPWEGGGAALGRYFAADAPAGLHPRIVVYRRPILTRAATMAEVAVLLRQVTLEQVAHLLNTDPDDA